MTFLFMIFGILFFTALLKGAETALAIAKPSKEQIKVLEAAKDAEAHYCTVSWLREGETRMIEAGIMTELERTVCDDDNCVECEPTRQKIHAKKRFEEETERRRLYNIEAKRKLRIAEKEKAERHRLENQYMLNDWEIVEATGKPVYQWSEGRWKWTTCTSCADSIRYLGEKPQRCAKCREKRNELDFLAYKERIEKDILRYQNFGRGY